MGIEMRKFLIYPSLFFIIACSQQPVSVVYKGNVRYTKDYYGNNKNDIVHSAEGDYTESPDGRIVRRLRSGETINRNAQQSHSSLKEITVKEGDTLYGLSEANNISSKEIVELNGLRPPYLLRVGQKIKIPQVKYHTVKAGENLSGIARKYDINLNSLVSVNDLKAPYILKPGDQIKLPSSASSQSIDKVAQTEEKSSPLVSSSSSSAERDIRVKKPEFKNNTFIWPAKGRIISKFGAKDGGLYNDGINISMPDGAPFRATEDGVVAYVGNELRGYGNLIIIKHSGNWISAYAHCRETIVQRGDTIKKGDIIGYVGSSGNVKSPQLYFSLRKGRQSVNPEDKLI
jgi:murein DD-endopeptidase MepM/ murein hydrolase activator NlpD